MTLHELESSDALATFASSNPKVVVCFSATWCGPCTRSKPDLIAMAERYRTEHPDVDVKFGIAYEHKVGNECVQSYGVRAFPTYLMLTDNGRTQAGKVEGANLERVQAMIDQAECKQDYGKGNSLGGGEAVSQEDARALRLKRLGGTTPPAPAKESPDVEMADAEEKDDTKKEVEEEEAVKPDGKCSEEPSSTIDPTANLNKEFLDQLTSGMGFSLIRAQKGLLHGEGGTLEGAIEWIGAHQDDIDIDEPIPLVAADADSKPQVAMSYKCNKTGKLFANMAQLELYAAQTGYSDFEECTEVKVPLTPEERALKMLEIKSLLKAKRAAREEQERKEGVEQEKQRRFMGQEMIRTKEQMDIDKRKRDAQLKKREKNAQRQERERIRAELAKDKAERMANGGKLQGRLGVDGYNPSAIQYDKDKEENGGESSTTTTTPKKKSSNIGPARVDECITKVSAYRAGGDGGKCLKILLAYVKNVVEKADEEKFRTVNMENKVYKAKIKPFLGAKTLLLAVGFQQNEGGTAMILAEDADRELLASTKTKLEEALVKYG